MENRQCVIQGLMCRFDSITVITSRLIHVQSIKSVYISKEFHGYSEKMQSSFHILEQL